MKYLFPYQPRKGQISIMENIYNTVQNKKIILISAPTGLGKTICSLVPAIKSGKQILFITPRQAQHRIVIQSAKDIRKELKVASIIGKQDMCDNPEIKKIPNFYDMCSLARRKGSKIRCDLFKNGTCRYYEEIEKCKTADIITANYRHIFDPVINDAFMSLTKFDVEDMILIIDEAHNLPHTLRDIASTRITDKTCERAQNELELLNMANFKIEGVNLVKYIAEDIIYKTISIDDEKRRLNKSYINIDEDIIHWLDKAGQKVIEIKQEDGTIAPISYLLAIYNFLSMWRDTDDVTHIRVFDRVNGNWNLNIKCLEPELLCEPLHRFYSTILMSGTLQPIQYYKDVLGLDDNTVMKSYPSIFPPENKIVIINNDLTTEYKNRNSEMFMMYGQKISNICNRVNGNIAVFFTSYSLMKQIKNYIDTTRDTITETSGKKINIHKELESRDKLLLGVMRGTLSEGVDYKDNLLSAIVICGLPFPMMDIEQKALMNYYDKKYGSGFTYASLYPSINVVLQTMGRGIRSETDVCSIYLFDKRFKQYERYFG